MTHPTYHDALRAALTDLRLRLSTGWHPVATSGMHPYQDDAEMRQVQARVECGDDGARPMHPDWARSLRDQCEAAGVPFHFKQWGEWAPHQPPDDVEVHTPRFMWDDTDPWTATWRLGKKAAGRVLDGRTHDAVPS